MAATVGAQPQFPSACAHLNNTSVRPQSRSVSSRTFFFLKFWFILKSQPHRIVKPRSLHSVSYVLKATNMRDHCGCCIRQFRRRIWLPVAKSASSSWRPMGLCPAQALPPQLSSSAGGMAVVGTAPPTMPPLGLVFLGLCLLCCPCPSIHIEERLLALRLRRLHGLLSLAEFGSTAA